MLDARLTGLAIVLGTAAFCGCSPRADLEKSRDSSRWGADSLREEEVAAYRPAVVRLAGALQSESRRERARAALQLAYWKWRSVDAVPALCVATQDEDYAVRTAAMSALVDIGKPSKGIEDALLKCLDDGDPRVRELAIDLLGFVSPLSREAGQQLVAFLGPDHRGAWAVAARAVGNCPTIGPEVRDRLKVLAKDSDEMVVINACGALAKLGEPHAAVQPLVELLRELDALTSPDSVELAYAVGTLQVIEEIGPPAGCAASELTRMLESQEGLVRLGAAQALLRIGAGDAGGRKLIEILQGDDAFLQGLAIRFMLERDLWPDGIEKALGGPLTSDSERVRLAAASAMVRLGQGRVALPVLLRIAACRISHSNNRSDAINQLGRLGDIARAAGPVLVEALTSDHESTRIEAALALRRIRRTSERR